MIVPQAYLASPIFQAAMADVVQSFDQLIGEFQSLGADLGAITNSVSSRATSNPLRATDRPSLIFHATCKFALKIIANGIPVHGGYLSAIVYGAIMLANTRHIAVDSELAWRYASLDHVVPDELREPVPIRQLAKELDMAYATIHRHVVHLIDADLCARRSGGVILPASAIDVPAFVATSEQLRIWFFAMLRELKAQGVDVRRPRRAPYSDRPTRCFRKITSVAILEVRCSF